MVLASTPALRAEARYTPAGPTDGTTVRDSEKRLGSGGHFGCQDVLRAQVVVRGEQKTVDPPTNPLPAPHCIFILQLSARALPRRTIDYSISVASLERSSRAAHFRKSFNRITRIRVKLSASFASFVVCFRTPPSLPPPPPIA